MPLETPAVPKDFPIKKEPTPEVPGQSLVKVKLEKMEGAPAGVEIKVPDTDEELLPVKEEATSSKAAPKSKVKGSKAPPLKMAEKQGPNWSDPRFKSDWPCWNRHCGTSRKSNQFASWIDCNVCGVRLQTIPREGFEARYKVAPKPEHVAKAIRECKEMMAERNQELPNQGQFKAILDMVVADEKFKKHTPGLMDSKKNKAAAKSSPVTSTAYPVLQDPPSEVSSQRESRSSPSTRSWEEVSMADSERELIQTLEGLTAEDLEAVRARAQQRREEARAQSSAANQSQ